MAKAVSVALIQMHCVPNREENLAKAERGIRQAAASGAQIICLSELFASEYFCYTRDPRFFLLAESIPGPTTHRLAALAKELNIVLLASLYEKTEHRFFNTATVFDADGTLLGIYRKMHIPNDPENGYDEAYYFANGDLGFKTFKTKFAVVAPLICWDQWFPEAARMAALDGAEIIFYPTAIGWPEGERQELNRAEHEAWLIMQRSHAIANNVFVASVNRMGKESAHIFWGSSFVADPYGRLLASGSVDKEEIVIASCDLSLISQMRTDWPFLDYRRIRLEAKHYVMPAEWEPHEATWLAWPHDPDTWPGRLDAIPPTYAKIVHALASTEKVYICVNHAEMEKSALQVLIQEGISDELLKNVTFFPIPTDASWSRDHGPIFVREANGQLVVSDWIFNAWGNKYTPFNQDDMVPQRIAKMVNLPLILPNMVFEGGSIEVNGQGLALTTEQCLLNKNRNPQLTKREIEEKLREYLGIHKIIWLKEGIVGDDTDGHIDDLARFVNPRTVVTVVEKNPHSPNYALLQDNLLRLQEATDLEGEPLKVVVLPMPTPLFDGEKLLPASYANFYIANQVVLMPTFRCQEDGEAQAILQELFPDRRVVGIDCVDLVFGLGTLHCSTQQQPTLKRS